MKIVFFDTLQEKNKENVCAFAQFALHLQRIESAQVLCLRHFDALNAFVVTYFTYTHL